MYDDWKDILGLSEEENYRAVELGFAAMEKFDNVIMRGTAREVLKKLEEEDRLGIVLLGRPYHNDPGINHEILEEFQKLGYPVFSQDSLPLDDEIVWKLFGDEVRAGLHQAPDGRFRRVEELVLGEHFAQGVGGEVRCPPSEPGGA